MTHLRIEQNNSVIEQVDSRVIEKLYQLAFSEDLDASSNLVGRLHTTATYQEYIDFLTQKFPNLYISADKNYIRFQDPTIQQIFVTAAGDGTGCTMEQLRNTYIPNSIKANTDIVYFDECQYCKPQTISWDYSSVPYNSSYFPSFWGCSSLKRVTLPEGLVIIDGKGNDFFQNCSSLEFVSLPSTIGFIGWGFFSNCNSLNTIIFNGSSMPNIHGDALSFINKSSITIYVPDDAVSTYRSSFTNAQVKPLSEYTN